MRDDKLKSILKKVFGHGDFRLNQLDIINSVLDGNDTLAIMPTGGGKSICYQIPALYKDGITIVISPLISLMHDQVLNLAQTGVKACFLNSSQDQDERSESQRQIRSGESKLVYVSPEGLLSGYFLNFLKEQNIVLIAIDEVHCVSQWGHEFRSDYMRLDELKDSFPNIPFIALTATADERTRIDILKQLRFKDANIFLSSFDRPNITYTICERENEVKQLADFISKEHESDTGIVYCLSRKKVERVAEALKELGYNAHAYHAGLSAGLRHKIQVDFNKEDRIIIVATIAFGMGIDRPDVRFVAHLDLPKSIESYYQETGRAGRDGRESNAWMVYGLQDVIKLSQMLETTDASEVYKKVARYKLDSMLSLCETVNCRRNYLLSYFDEENDQACGNCDSCLNPAITIDATVDAQKLLSTIYRTGQTFGAGYIIDVLRGSKNAKILERRHDSLSVYGIGISSSKNYWNTILRHLLNHKFIAIKNWEYRNLCLTAKSESLLKGQEVFRIREIKDSVKVVKKKKIISFDHGKDDLFEDLRSLRRELAAENNVPPFMVFGDKSLHDMCLLLPRDRGEFLMVNGVGESKCEKFGQPFINCIARHL